MGHQQQIGRRLSIAITTRDKTAVMTECHKRLVEKVGALSELVSTLMGARDDLHAIDKEGHETCI